MGRRTLTVLLLVLAPWLLVPWLVARWVVRRGGDLSRFDQRDAALMEPASAVGPAHDAVVTRLEEGHARFGRTLDQRARRREVRAWLDELGADAETDAQLLDVDVDGLRGEWVVPPGADTSRRLLYVHGGAFEAGSPTSHRPLTTELARRSGMPVFVLDYRLLPEHRRIDTIEDTRAGWAYVTTTGPDGPAPAAAAFVAGDSAGANLALAVTQELRGTGDRQPDGVVVFSPPTDSTFSSPSLRENIATDPFIGPSIGRLMRFPGFALVLGTWAAARIRPDDPRLSPLRDDLAGLPPVLVQASSDEMLVDDAVRYANKAREAGSPVVLQLWPRMVHVWQSFLELPQSAAALDQVEAFLADPERFVREAPNAARGAGPAGAADRAASDAAA